LYTITGRVKSFKHIEVHSYSTVRGRTVKTPYLQMEVINDTGTYQLLIPPDNNIVNRVDIGDVLLIKATYVAANVGSEGVYNLHSYQKVNCWLL